MKKIIDFTKKNINHVLLTLVMTGILSNYLYRWYINFDLFKKDLYAFLLEQLITLSYTGTSILVLLKIYLVKNWKKVISEFMFAFFKKRLEEHIIYNRIDDVINFIQMKSFSSSKGRQLLMKKIIDIENLQLKFFLSSTIQGILIENKTRSDINFIVDMFKNNFIDYINNVLDLLQHDEIPEIILGKYTDSKYFFTETVLDYFELKRKTSANGYMLVNNLIDVLSVSIEMFLKKDIYNIDKLNGELDGLTYEGYNL